MHKFIQDPKHPTRLDIRSLSRLSQLRIPSEQDGAFCAREQPNRSIGDAHTGLIREANITLRR